MGPCSPPSHHQLAQTDTRRAFGDLQPKEDSSGQEPGMPSRAAGAGDGDGAEMGSSTDAQRCVTAHEGCGGMTGWGGNCCTGEVGAWTDRAPTWQWLLPACLLGVLFGDHWDSCATRNRGEKPGEGSEPFKSWLLPATQCRGRTGTRFQALNAGTRTRT